jgi:hypothetical protein
MREKYEIILRAMQQGQEIKLPDGYTYAMVEGEVCIVLKCYYGRSCNLDEQDEPDGIRYCHSDMSLNYFLAQCNEMGDEEVAGIAANTALTRMKRDNLQRRGRRYKEGK